jgi:hypothetical protein
MPMKLMTGAALAGAAPAEAQSFQNVVETFYDDEFRSHPIAATAYSATCYSRLEEAQASGPCATAFVGRTHDRKRPSHTQKNPCKLGAIHT